MKNTTLTNENLRKYFENDFELANFAIKIAREYIKDQEDATINDVLEELKNEISQKNQ